MSKFSAVLLILACLCLAASASSVHRLRKSMTPVADSAPALVERESSDDAAITMTSGVSAAVVARQLSSPKTVLLSLALESQKPVDEIETLIDELTAELTEDQATGKQQFQKLSSDCDTSSAKDEIANSEGAQQKNDALADKYTATAEKLRAQIPKLEQAIADAEKGINNEETKITGLRTDRAANKKIYLRTRKEFKKALAEIDRLRLISQESRLDDRSTHINKLSDSLLEKSAGLTPEHAMLLTTAANALASASGTEVDSIYNLLNQLRDRLKASISELDAAEEIAIGLFFDGVTSRNAAIDKLTAEITAVTNRISAVSGKACDATNAAADATAEANKECANARGLTIVVEQKDELCTRLRANFKLSQASIQGDLDTLATLRKALNRQGGLRDQLTDTTAGELTDDITVGVDTGGNGVKSMVKCVFTIDNSVKGVFVNGKDMSDQVTGPWTSWPQAKVLTFEDDDSVDTTLAIYGWGAESGSCHNEGLLLECSAVDPGQSTRWDQVYSNTADWVSTGSNTDISDQLGEWSLPDYDASEWTAPCTSTSGFGLGVNADKIWGGTGAKFSYFRITLSGQDIVKPPPSITCSFTIDNTVNGVFLNGKDVTSQTLGALNNWGSLKTLTFHDDPSQPMAFGVYGWGAETGSCHNEGLLLQCQSTDGSPSRWNNVKSDRSNWKSKGSLTDIVGSLGDWSSPDFDESSWDVPCQSTSGFHAPLQAEKIWGGTQAKFSYFRTVVQPEQ